MAESVYLLHQPSHFRPVNPLMVPYVTDPFVPTIARQKAVSTRYGRPFPFTPKAARLGKAKHVGPVKHLVGQGLGTLILVHGPDEENPFIGVDTQATTILALCRQIDSNPGILASRIVGRHVSSWPHLQATQEFREVVFHPSKVISSSNTSNMRSSHCSACARQSSVRVSKCTNALARSVARYLPSM